MLKTLWWIALLGLSDLRPGPSQMESSAQRKEECKPRIEKVLRVAVLLPGVETMTDPHDLGYHNQLEHTIPAVELAGLTAEESPMPSVKSFARFEELLPGWKLNLTYGNTKCSSTDGPLKAFDLHCQKDFFLGPVCPYVLAPVARFSGRWSTPIVTTGGQANAFRSKGQYPLLTTIAGTYNKFGAFFKNLLKKFDWQTVSFLFHTYPEESAKGKSACQFTLGEVYLNMGGVRNTNLSYMFFDETAENKSTFGTVLEKIKVKARVVILCASPDKVRDILLAAEDLGMLDRGEYVFFNVELFASRKPEEYKPWYDPDASDEENNRAKHAYEAVLTVTASSSNTPEYDDFAKAVKEVARTRFNYTYEGEVNTFVANFHDAVLLYATALRETINEHGLEAKARGDLIVNKMWNRTVQGVTGNVSIDSNGDRNADYALLDMEPETGNFKVVAVYQGRSNSFAVDDTDQIHWPAREGKGPPTDRPECGFDGSLCDNKGTILKVLFISITALLVIMGVAFFFTYRRFKENAEVASMTWRIRPDEILSNVASKGRTGSRLSLARVSVAESLDSMGMPEKNQQIFVKTVIHQGVQVAQKPIDVARISLTRNLLLELKRMKDLHHDHLVRFIGACIDPSSPCLLTEYCPRGSLQDILEDDDLQLDWNFRHSLIHDIVKGMAFIHSSDLKIHGNLKSSNCVVDSRFVLKLTDFGLHTLRQEITYDEGHVYWKSKLWTSPELLREDLSLNQCPSQDSSYHYSSGTLTHSPDCQARDRATSMSVDPGDLDEEKRKKRKQLNKKRKSTNTGCCGCCFPNLLLGIQPPELLGGSDDSGPSHGVHQPLTASASATTTPAQSHNPRALAKLSRAHATSPLGLGTSTLSTRPTSRTRNPGTQRGDVYSFAIIVHEIVMRQGPFYITNEDGDALDPRGV